MKKLIGAMLISVAAVSYAAAQSHSGHEASSVSEETASTKAYVEANEKMHKDMMIKFSGDADKDFVESMIPHHQGAIDMAKVALQYGKDPEIKKLAEGVISAQEQEIKQMQDWLKNHEKK